MSHHPSSSIVQAGLAACAVVACALASAQAPDTLLHTLPPPASVQSGAQTGTAVATDGVRTVVGSPQDDLSATNSGLARVYDAVTGALLYVLPNPTPNANDQFGTTVAISGTRVLVGAPSDDLGANDAGVVHAFDLAGADPTSPIALLSNPAPHAGANYGSAVAISGPLAVVGAYDYNTTANSAGRVWVYDLGSATPAVAAHVLDKPGAQATDWFGYSVAISGTSVVVGAYRDDTGATDAGSAYVYNLSSGTPTTPVQTLNNPTPQTSDFFGGSVSISGSYVAVGADRDNTAFLDSGAVYFYHLGGATPAIPIATVNNPTPASSDNFGISVAVSGSRLIVGAHGDNTDATDAGSAYVYDLTSISATLAHSIFNPTPGVDDRFGCSVAISGTTVVVGANLDDDIARDSGAAYSYNLAGGTPASPVIVWNDASPSAGDEFGKAIAISGSRLVIGAPFNDSDVQNGGVVHVYDLAGGVPDTPVLTIHNPEPTTDDYFGYTLAISGSMLAVSAYQDDTAGSGAGAVYVYDLSTGTPGVPVHSLYEPVPSSQFGLSLDISGNRVVVGAIFSDTGATDAGSAYVFDLAGGTPGTPAFTLHNPAPSANDNFGRAVGISGTQVVVGAYFDDTSGSNSGTAYVYDLTGGTPTLPAVTLNNPFPASNDWFGRSAAISGASVIIGAWNDDTGASNTGSAYIYDVSSGTPSTPVFTLNNPELGAGANFSGTVDISGTRVLVGAFLDDFAAINSGSVYLYDLAGGTPTSPITTFRNPTADDDDEFGQSISLDGPFSVVGAHRDDLVSPSQGYAYIFGVPPEIAVEQPVGTNLTDGSATIPFGDFQFGTSPVRTFIVRNTGATNLLNLAVAKGGSNPTDFTVNTTSLGTFILPGASATFSVTMTPATSGLKTATLQITNTDTDENPFDINLTGQSYSATSDTDGDGMKDWQEFQLSALGFNWQVANTALVTTYFSTASQNGLYTTSQVQDLNVGMPLLQQNAGTGTFTLTLGVEKSTTLGGTSWSPLPMTVPQVIINAQGKLEFQFTVPDNAAFFRVQAQ